MKKIIIVHKSLGIGGVETSLMYFIKRMEKYADIRLLTWEECEINNSVSKELFSKNLSSIHKLAYLPKQKIKTLNFADKIKAIGYKVLLKTNLLSKKIKKEIEKTKAEYVADIGICFAPWEISMEIYKQKIKCKHNICIVHGDVSKYNCVPNAEENLKCFDTILCVSESCANKFKETYPQFADKVDYAYNFQDDENIINKSTETQIVYNEGFNIVSVSRLSEEKAYLRSLKVFKQLHNEGYQFTWNIIGDGEERDNIEKYILDNDMGEYVVLHGQQINPYPYIKAADLFFLGSYHEAAPMVYAESMLLEVPVITTETCSAQELVGAKGFVCENSETAIYEKFKYILEDVKVLQEKKKHLKSYKLNNEKTENKLVKLLNVENK